MGSFTLIKYDGEDSGEVLVTMLEDTVERETHELPARVSRPIGFQPNPEPDEETDPDDDPDEEGDDDGQSDPD